MSEKKCGIYLMLRRYAFFTAAALLLLLIPGISILCAAEKEYTVKAVFILNFARYAAWPDNAFESESSPCILCVTENEDLEQAFRSIEGKKIGSRELSVRFTETPGDSEPCHMIFFSRTADQQDVLKILESVKGKPVLTIGEMKEFIGHGGMITFLTRSGRLVFGINMDVVRQQKVKLSSRLLKLAILIGEK